MNIKRDFNIESLKGLLKKILSNAEEERDKRISLISEISKINVEIKRREKLLYTSASKKPEIIKNDEENIKLLKQELRKLNNFLENMTMTVSEEEISIYESIYRKLINKQYIGVEELKIIDDLMHKHNVMDLDIIFILNILKKNNMDIRGLSKEYFNSEEADAFRFLTFGYEILPDTTELLKENEKEVSDASVCLTSEIDYFKSSVLFLNKVTKIILNKTPEVKLLIMGNIINYIIDELSLMSNFLSSEAFYNDEHEKHEIIVRYKYLTDIYKKLREFYYLIYDTIYKEEKVDDTANHLIFPNNGYGQSYLEKDLKDIREESYYKIYELLEAFTHDIKVSTLFYSNYSGYRRIVSDQIRIVLKPLGRGYYAVLGVGIKKANRDDKLYESIINRKVVDIDTSNEDQMLLIMDEASEVFDRIKTFCLENGRKGSR